MPSGGKKDKNVKTKDIAKDPGDVDNVKNETIKPKDVKRKSKGPGDVEEGRNEMIKPEDLDSKTKRKSKGPGDVEEGKDQMIKPKDLDSKAKLAKEATNMRKILAIVSAVGVVIGVILLAVLIGISATVAKSLSNKVEHKLCEKIQMYAAAKKLEGTGMDKIPEVIDINRCKWHMKCNFDTKSCTTSCPIGFKMKKGCPVSCECAKAGVLQYDIRFDDSTLPALLEQMDPNSKEDFVLFSAESGIQLWNENIESGRVKIPYQFATDFETENEATFHEAIKQFQRNTCIDFVPRNDEPDYLYIRDGEDCSSSYSRSPGKNVVYAAACYSSSHLIHVLMHALGFHHEHMRGDRDAYLGIQWNNIDPAFESAFNKLSSEKFLASDTAFDTGSITMLNGYAFAKVIDESAEPTMIDLDTNKPALGGSSTLTRHDLNRIAIAYCDGVHQNAMAEKVSRLRSSGETGDMAGREWTEWSAWSRCQATCGPSIQTRVRSCEELGFKAFNCPGHPKEAKGCELKRCGTVGAWEKWGEWGECSKTCGYGLKTRFRQCSPQDKCKGLGPSSALQGCNTERCSNEKPLFSEWSVWGECDPKCGQGQRSRTRDCRYRDGTLTTSCESDEIDKNGVETEFDICDQPECADISSPSQPKMRMATFEEVVITPKISKVKRYEGFSLKTIKISPTTCDPLSNFYWFLGDFNGDGRTDTMCGENVDLLKVYLTNGDGSWRIRWMGRLNCAIRYIVIGDFNGDGADDIFCKDDALTRNLIYPSKDGGIFRDHYDAGPFCMNVLDKMQVIDVNGDDKADLVCKHAVSEEDTEIYLSSLSI